MFFVFLVGFCLIALGVMLMLFTVDTGSLGGGICSIVLLFLGYLLCTTALESSGGKVTNPLTPTSELTEYVKKPKTTTPQETCESSGGVWVFDQCAAK